MTEEKRKMTKEEEGSRMDSSKVIPLPRATASTVAPDSNEERYWCQSGHWVDEKTAASPDFDGYCHGEQVMVADVDRGRQGKCEVIRGSGPQPLKPCGRDAVYRYPAMGGGYMRLCRSHGAKHVRWCERWTTVGWMKPEGE